MTTQSSLALEVQKTAGVLGEPGVVGSVVEFVIFCFVVLVLVVAVAVVL
jgi:hypothetical protein